MGALAFYNSRDSDSDLYIPGNTPITPEIEILRDYVRIDTTNPPGNELAAARFLAGHLRAAGVEPEIIETAPGRAALYARIEGKRRGDGLLLMHHMDVMPADPAEWSYPPFEAEIKQNMMWGRGTLDMKSIGVCHLLAFLSVFRSSIQPERDLVFLAVPDEERGSRAGAEWLFDHRPDVLDEVRYALNEGGITETIAGEVNYVGIEIGTKILTTARAYSSDRGALERISVALEPWADPKSSPRLLPGVREYFLSVADNRIRYSEELRNIDRLVADGDVSSLPTTYRRLLFDVIWTGKIGADREELFLPIVIHTLPDRDPGMVIDMVGRIVESEGARMAINRRMPATPLSSTSSPFYRELSEVVREHFGDVRVGPLVVGTILTDSRFLRPRGIDAYGFWPYPVDFFQTQGIHKADERIRLDWYLDGVNVVRDLTERWVYAR
ncbi:MAG TPA: M20/M25/M40 family metallo-hydrolase [Thermoanaerobaculia bacterium]|nr:M20/M25/M40 family metallo-hydrolase [Thermoanaerobaculia bacterium]